MSLFQNQQLSHKQYCINVLNLDDWKVSLVNWNQEYAKDVIPACVVS